MTTLGATLTTVQYVMPDGWISANETWTFASASSFTVSGVDVTAKYPAGANLRMKQGGGYKYFQVSSSSFSTNTTVNVDVNTDYTIANSAITDNDFSYMLSPQGFPAYFAYTTTSGGLTETSGTKTAQFIRRGKQIQGRIKFLFGASSAVTGAVTFTLPVTASSFRSTANAGIIGWADYLDSGTANYAGIVRQNSTTVIGILAFGASGVHTALSSTVPHTWATNDEINVEFSYPAA